MDVFFRGVTKIGYHDLWDLGLSTIRELETEQGILASGREEIYGCIFGRDSLITALKLLAVYRKTKDEYFLTLVKKILTNLLALQGREWNIESGEEPGKCIHEYRPDNHQHLTERTPDPTLRGLPARAERPWYVYRDGTLRNYDTVDATPLLLIAIHEYILLADDKVFMQDALHGVEAALFWLVEHGDNNNDGFIDYLFRPERNFGGLVTQNWMDSYESVLHDDGERAKYPIAPVEVQAYAYAALRAWGSYFLGIDPERALTLLERAHHMKRLFNARFVFHDNGKSSLAFAIDGDGRLLRSARSTMGHVLWAAYRSADGARESILDEVYLPDIVERLMQKDLFEPGAGLRTLSAQSKQYRPNSYHNGSIWPHDTALVAEGFEHFGFVVEAEQIRDALKKAYEHFKTPIELFVHDSEFSEYLGRNGQRACKKQAWSAAALLDIAA